MENYKVTYIGDKYIREVHHINIDYDGHSYSVIFGKYVNGGFFSIPNWNCGGELARYDDTIWNEGSIYKALRKRKAAKIIAIAISDYIKKVNGESNYGDSNISNNT